MVKACKTALVLRKVSNVFILFIRQKLQILNVEHIFLKSKIFKNNNNK